MNTDLQKYVPQLLFWVINFSNLKECNNNLFSHEDNINYMLEMPLGAIYLQLCHGERRIEGSTENTVLGQNKKREKP